MFSMVSDILRNTVEDDARSLPRISHQIKPNPNSLSHK